MRKILVAGNWKSNGTASSNKALVEKLNALVPGANVDLLVCPPFIYIPSTLEWASGGHLAVGAQNCSATEEGAYTGECTAGMLKDLGLEWVILGHSERRSLFGETDDVVAVKVGLALAAGINPIVCVGETLEEREAGQAEAVCLRQMEAVLARSEPNENWVIAYEPVWAIGTGKTASSADAQQMHSVLRKYLSEKVGETAKKIRILYGGSVKAGNAAELFSKADIDGALVGGASLSADEFAGIIAATNA